MIYQYKCDKCDQVVEITKTVNQFDREEKCPKCKSVMHRVYTASGIKTSDGYKS